MLSFRLLLIALWIGLAVYTGGVIARHGLDLFPVFFGDILTGAWPGQFNADFSCFLILSALWTAWRHRFSPAGLLLGAVAFVGGAGFLLPYLLILSMRARGDVTRLLLGDARVEERGSALRG